VHQLRSGEAIVQFDEIDVFGKRRATMDSGDVDDVQRTHRIKPVHSLAWQPEVRPGGVSSRQAGRK
jgi:hypothetical protein